MSLIFLNKNLLKSWQQARFQSRLLHIGLAVKDQVVGRRVQIIGLTKTLEFNDLWGKVEHFDSSCKRFAVQLLPAEGVPMTVKLRGENLRMPPVLSLSFKDASGKQANAWQPNLRAVRLRLH
eukprot:g20734.t1